MKKRELIATVANKSGLPRADVGKVVDATLDTITKALKKNDDLRLVGFGTFAVSKRSSTQGRDPQTGQPIKIPAKKYAKFRPGKKLSEELAEPEGTMQEPVVAVPDEAALEVAAALLDHANRRLSRLRRDRPCPDPDRPWPPSPKFSRRSLPPDE
jgi:DNA-binding protein HU-beta